MRTGNGREEENAYIRQAIDKLMGIGLLACLLNELSLPSLGHVFPFCTDEAVRDITEDGIVEEKRLLLHQTYLRAPPGEVEILDVHAANRDGTRDPGLLQ